MNRFSRFAAIDDCSSLFPSEGSRDKSESDAMDGEEVARPALLAYTTSGQAAARAKKGASDRRSKDGKKRRGGTGAPLPPMRRGKKEAEIKFDEDARRDFLTGFRKRKQARIEKGREKAKQREKEERKVMRTQAREERKKQAAENVKAERIAYGAAEASDEDEEEDIGDGSEVDGEDDEERQAAYNTESHHTTVTIEEFDPNADFDALPVKAKAPAVARKAKAKPVQSVEALPPSSRRASKRKQRDAGDISKLVDLEEERKSAYVPEALRLQEEEEAQEGQSGDVDGVRKSKKPGSERPKKFHYETKLERAKNKAAIREVNQKRAEKRREDNRIKHSSQRGGRGGKRGGKR